MPENPRSEFIKKFAFAGAAVAALLAVPALAVQPAPAREAGQPLTRAAVQSQVQAQFARADANRDGFITQAEVRAIARQVRGQRQARRSERRAEAFTRLDANRDGTISREEFDARR